MIAWLGFSVVATASAMAFYAFMLSLVWPRWRAMAGRMLSLPHPANQPEIAALDAYRGLAAATVALAHIWVFCRYLFDATQQVWFPPLSVAGNKAVPVFVMLSGFLVFRAADGVRSLDDLRRYLLRRFWRIYPVYLFTVLLGFLCGQGSGGVPGFVAQVFMVRSVELANLAFVNPPAWSLYVEVLFYAVIPLWILVCRPRLLACAALSFLVFLVVDPLGARELWLWKYFFAGVMVSEFLRRHGGRVGPRAAAVVFVLGLALFALDLRSALGAPYDWFDALGLVPKNAAEYTVGLAVAVALMMVGSLRHPAIAAALSVKPLRVLGAVSYSLFLLHPFFILAVFPAFRFDQASQLQNLVDPALRAPAWYAPFVMLPGAIAWAMVCFVCIERPLLLRRPA